MICRSQRKHTYAHTSLVLTQHGKSNRCRANLKGVTEFILRQLEKWMGRLMILLFLATMARRVCSAGSFQAPMSGRLDLIESEINLLCCEVKVGEGISSVEQSPTRTDGGKGRQVQRARRRNNCISCGLMMMTGESFGATCFFLCFAERRGPSCLQTIVWKCCHRYVWTKRRDYELL